MTLLEIGRIGSHGSNVETINFIFDSFGLPPPTELNNYLGDVFYPTENSTAASSVL